MIFCKSFRCCVERKLLRVERKRTNVETDCNQVTIRSFRTYVEESMIPLLELESEFQFFMQTLASACDKFMR